MKSVYSTASADWLNFCGSFKAKTIFVEQSWYYLTQSWKIFNKDLKIEKTVFEMCLKNVEARAQAEKGWHFQDTDSPTFLVEA